MMNFVFTTLLIFLSGTWSLNHPVHISITNMDYFEEENKISLSIKVFKDDLELLFAHLYQVDMNIDSAENVKNQQDVINAYFENHLVINNDSLNYEVDFKELEMKDDQILFYYEYNLDRNLDSLEIMNTIFLDLYFDQKNMLICNYKGKEQGYLFNLQNTKHRIDFNDF